jgi:hypothetical protein
MDARLQKEDADSSKEVDFLLLVSTLLGNRRMGHCKFVTPTPLTYHLSGN